MFRIPLGAKVRDVITGGEGIAVARTLWLAGCERVSYQPVLGDDYAKERKIPELVCVDEAQLELLDPGRTLALPGRAADPAPTAQPLPIPAPVRAGGGGRDDAAALRR